MRTGQPVFFRFTFFVCLCISLSVQIYAQDSTYGEIRVVKPKPTPEPEPEPVKEGRQLLNNGDKRFPVLMHGFFVGADYSAMWSYRLGFFYNGSRASTSLSFRHAWTTGYTGAVACLQFPLSKTKFWYRLQPGLEWTSMGKASDWYHSVNTYVAFLFPFHSNPDMQIHLGYNFNPVPGVIDNTVAPSWLAGVYFHL